MISALESKITALEQELSLAQRLSLHERDCTLVELKKHIQSLEH
jgi:hypothetical protein